MEEWFGFVALCAVALMVGGLLSQQESDSHLGSILFGGLVLRIVGSVVRYQVLMRAYNGVGDASGYFAFGVQYADRIASLDFDFVGVATADGGHWWGSDFIRTLSGFVVFIVGESMPGAFLAFALIGFGGVVLLIHAYRVAVGKNYTGYATLACFLPSLWFWPSSIGKESVMVLAAGLVVRGYVGSGTRSWWFTLASGIALAGAIRPHVAAIMGACVAVAELLRARGGARNRWVVGGLAIVLCAVAIDVGLTGLGLDDADLEGIEEEVLFRAAQTQTGGSEIARASGIAMLPMAFVNVLFRPFPGEGGALGFFSGVEVWMIWLYTFARRTQLWSALRGWRQSALLCIAPPFTGAITLLYGLAFANLGIIARQRVVILPFLLLLPALAMSASAAPNPSRQALPRIRMKPAS